MKKTLFFIPAMILMAMFLLSACGQDDASTPPEPETTDSVTAQTAPLPQAPPAPSTDATAETKGTATPNDTTDSTDGVKEEIPATQSSEATSHNAMNSLDYLGTYTASPQDSARQSGIARLTLYKDGSCLLVMRDGKEVRDTYTWDTTGSIIHVGPENFPALSFFVGEGYLILDSTTPQGDGPRFTQETR